MKHRAVRVALFLLLLAATAVAAYQIVTLQRRIAIEQAADHDFDALARSAIGRVTELRAAQQAYVAAGQGEAYWIPKVASHLEAIDTDLAALRRLATAPGTVTAVEAAAEVVDNFARMDARARDYVRNGQNLTASDLIFTDGLEMTTAAAGHLESARKQEQDAHERALSQYQRTQAYILATAAASAILVTLLLIPTGQPSRPAAVAPSSDRTPAQPRESETAATPRADQLARAPEAAATPPLAVARRETPAMPDLKAAAALCGDFARVLDPGELPGLLERAAVLLEAEGIIVWMGDASGHALRPVLAHGYAPQTLGRMGLISRNSDNATAAAYRGAQLQIVSRGTSSNGAIVAPIVTPAGCVGVMAAETRNGAEAHESIRAIAAILAAQLAMLVPAIPGSEAQEGSL